MTKTISVARTPLPTVARTSLVALPVLAIIVLFVPNHVQAALSYVGGATTTGNSAAYNLSLTSLVGGVASAPAAGDLVVVSAGFVSTSNGNPGVGTAGYTEVADLYGNDNRDANFSVNWKVMGASPDTTVSCNGSGLATDGAVCAAQVWRGVDQSTPMDTAATTATGNNSSVPDGPSIIPASTGAVVIATGLGTGTSVDTSVTAPVGYTNQVDTTVDPGNAAIVGMASKAWTSGAENPAVWTTWTTSTGDSWGAVTLAIRSATKPSVTTDSASADVTSATLFGSISATGGEDANQSGFAYGTDSTLATVISTTTLGAQVGAASFDGAISSLSESTTYYYRAYATNSAGTGYGTIKSFTTGSATTPPQRRIRLFSGGKLKVIGGTLKIMRLQ